MHIEEKDRIKILYCRDDDAVEKKTTQTTVFFNPVCCRSLLCSLGRKLQVEDPAFCYIVSSLCCVCVCAYLFFVLIRFIMTLNFFSLNIKIRIHLFLASFTTST